MFSVPRNFLSVTTELPEFDMGNGIYSFLKGQIGNLFAMKSTSGNAEV